MIIFTVLLALACVACDAEDGPTGLKGAVGNEDAGLTNLDVTWTEVGTTEAQGLLTPRRSGRDGSGRQSRAQGRPIR